MLRIFNIPSITGVASEGLNPRHTLSISVLAPVFCTTSLHTHVLATDVLRVLSLKCGLRKVPSCPHTPDQSCHLHWECWSGGSFEGSYN